MTDVVQKSRSSARTAECSWCGARKPVDLMRHPLSSRGPTPSTCHACRESHPDESWCDFHNAAHPAGAFPVVDRPIGLLNICHVAVAFNAAAKRGSPQRVCDVCGESRDSWFFRGGRSKSPVCRSCDDTHPGERWCVECRSWLSPAEFHRTGRGNALLTRRCKTCDLAWRHGLSRDAYDELLGDLPECAACGSTNALKIDHDHAHCPTRSGCADCVRGLLCHQCNTAEGLLRTAERARALADYMERWKVC